MQSDVKTMKRLKVTKWVHRLNCQLLSIFSLTWDWSSVFLYFYSFSFDLTNFVFFQIMDSVKLTKAKQRICGLKIAPNKVQFGTRNTPAVVLTGTIVSLFYRDHPQSSSTGRIVCSNFLRPIKLRFHRHQMHRSSPGKGHEQKASVRRNAQKFSLVVVRSHS